VLGTQNYNVYVRMLSTNEFVYKKWTHMPHAFKPIFVMIKILITFFSTTLRLFTHSQIDLERWEPSLHQNKKTIKSLVKLLYNSVPNSTS
jgi:hypothetical protein